MVQGDEVGRLSVWYAEERPDEDIGPFLKEEERLIRTIAERLGHSILFHRMYETRQELEDASRELEAEKESRWRAPIDLLRRSDRDLYLRVARKMVNHLCWAGVEGGQELLQEIYGTADEDLRQDPNYPARPAASTRRSCSAVSPSSWRARYPRGRRRPGADPRLGAWRTRRASCPPSSTTPVRRCPTSRGALRRFHHLLDDGAELSPPPSTASRSP